MRDGFWLLLFVMLALIIFVLVLGMNNVASAHDERWHDDDPPEVKAWYGKLLQPDTIITAYNDDGKPFLNGNSCCGQADAYYVDVSVVTDKMSGSTSIVATIDDDRDDGKLNGRMHEDNGTQYVVPPNKVVGAKQRVGNPTGHAIIFLGTRINIGDHQVGPRAVLCFVDNAGI